MTMKMIHMFLLTICIVASSEVAALSIRGSAKHEEIDSHHLPRRWLQGNTTTGESIQEVINASLSETNFYLREKLDDPYETDLSETVPLGCNQLYLSVVFEEIKGLSSVDVKNLTIDDDSVTVFPDDCDDNTWKGKASIYVGFDNSLTAGQPRARVHGTCRGKDYDQPLTVSISSSGVYYTGSYNLEGIAGNTVDVDVISRAETLGTLDLNTPATTVSISLFPSGLSEYEETARTQLEAAFRKQLVDDVEPELRHLLEVKIPTAPLGIIGSVQKFFTELAEEFLDSSGDIFGDVLEDVLGGDEGDDNYYDDYYYNDDNGEGENAEEGNWLSTILSTIFDSF